MLEWERKAEMAEADKDMVELVRPEELALKVEQEPLRLEESKGNYVEAP